MHLTTSPVGLWVILTAVSTFVDILPAGPARTGEGDFKSCWFDGRFNSVRIGKTATEAVEVWTRPDFSVARHPLDAMHSAFLLYFVVELLRPIFPKTLLCIRRARF